MDPNTLNLYVRCCYSKLSTKNECYKASATKESVLNALLVKPAQNITEKLDIYELKPLNWQRRLNKCKTKNNTETFRFKYHYTENRKKVSVTIIYF
jgi:hypothetical protein